VIPLRAGAWPESKAARVGVQEGAAEYALVNRMLSAERRLRFGVS
jgi:hypothetical protein